MKGRRSLLLQETNAVYIFQRPATKFEQTMMCLFAFRDDHCSKGPRIDPCGTPDLTLAGLEEWPSMETN